MTPDFMESPLSQIPPADPTPSAAVAPTGGETMDRLADQVCEWLGESERSNASVRALDAIDLIRSLQSRLQAALSSPVRAERGEAERLRDALQEIADAEPALTGFLDRVETWDVFAHRLQEDALAALTPTPPATPTEPKHVCGLRGYNPMIDPPCPGCVRATPTPSEEPTR